MSDVTFMNYAWTKTVFPIAALFSFRMLGLFLLIPVFSVYAEQLEGATSALIGFALGAYGLSQGILQMPFGLLSDRFGRKPLITIGLILFVLGSLLGAVAESIYGMILARILQGAGAIGSVLIALVADLTKEEQRTKAMAVIGMSIGSSFSLAMVLSPMITARYGLSGIFYFTAALASCGLIVLHAVIPTPVKETFHAESETNTSLLKTVVSNTQLLRLNASIFAQHFILTATFFAIPILLNKHIQLGHLGQAWHFYLPLMVASFFGMIPLIIYAEKRKQLKNMLHASIAVTTMTQAALAFIGLNWPALCLSMLLYFIFFNNLEALLPSIISRQTNPGTKGTAMGVYSTCQFLGLFMGGASAGIVYQWGSIQGIFMANCLLSLLWFFIMFDLNPISNSNKKIFSTQPET